MFGEDQDVETMFEAIYAFDKDQPEKINMEFVESLNTFWESKGYLTEKQKGALSNIYNGFKLGE